MPNPFEGLFDPQLQKAGASIPANPAVGGPNAQFSRDPMNPILPIDTVNAPANRGAQSSGIDAMAGAGVLPASTPTPTPKVDAVTAQVAPKQSKTVAQQAPVSTVSDGIDRSKAGISSAQDAISQDQAAEAEANHIANSTNSVTQAVSKAEDSPNSKSVLPILLQLLSGGLEAASGYYQGKAGNYNPTMTQQRLAREQEQLLQKNQIASQQKMQQAQFVQELAIKKADYGYQSDLMGIQNKYSLALNSAQTANEKQLIQARMNAEIEAANQKRLQAYQAIGKFGPGLLGSMGVGAGGTAAQSVANSPRITPQEANAMTSQNLGILNQVGNIGGSY